MSKTYESQALESLGKLRERVASAGEFELSLIQAAVKEVETTIISRRLAA